MIPFVFGVLILGALVVYMCTYQVAFNEMAVLTTFGRAGDKASKNVDGTDAGLHWKWPWPIQQVRKYDARIRILEDRLEQQETRDKQVVVIKAYVAWRVAEPLEFYRSMRTEATAERILRDRLRAARAEIGNFTFDDLTNVDPLKLRLAEAERNILERMNRGLGGQELGLEISRTGITRLILPEQITKSVFERMRETRQRLAQKARSEGDAIARKIRAQARSDEQRIVAFADRKATTIRAEGDEAAAEYYRLFAENEDFAVFLRKMEALQETLKHNTTFLLDTSIAPFDMLEEARSLKSRPQNAQRPAQQEKQ